MASHADLTDLFGEAGRLPSDANRLLMASTLAERICEVVLHDPGQLQAVRAAVRSAAEAAGCDRIVGASPAAAAVVDGLDDGRAEGKRALLFDLVQITGATLKEAASRLGDVETKAAVLLDLRLSRGGSDGPLSVALHEPARC